MMQEQLTPIVELKKNLSTKNVLSLKYVKQNDSEVYK